MKGKQRMVQLLSLGLCYLAIQHLLLSILRSSTGGEDKVKVAMCTIIKSEEYYLEEWLHYNLRVLEFDHIFLFDNSVDFEMNTFLLPEFLPSEEVSLIHFPGPAIQRAAYTTCIQQCAAAEYTHVAFFDADEFLVLKRHGSMADFLNDYLPTKPMASGRVNTKRSNETVGAISVFWRVMVSGDRQIYQPRPVSYRFRFTEASLSDHVKTVCRLQDIDMNKTPHAHFCQLREGSIRTTTSGKQIKSYIANPRRKDDVAVLYHYWTKSHKEYILKRARGRGAEIEDVDELIELAKQGVGLLIGSVFDDTVWKKLVKARPAYKMFDAYKVPSPRYRSRSSASAVLCATTENEEAYIDEWVDYHLALGFTGIILYDTTERFEIRQWGAEKGNRNVRVYHLNSNKASAKDLCHHHARADWVAFWEVGNMLILRRHQNVLDLLDDFDTSDVISINQQLYQVSDQTVYRPRPYTQRFRYRSPSAANSVLEIERVQGRQKTRTFYISANLSTEVAVVFTYPLRSSKEYRKRFDPNSTRSLDVFLNATEYSSEGWNMTKEYVPWYALYEKFQQN